MGKTILELFKSKKLDTGTTASEKYDIRNSKDTPVSSASGILSPSFGLLNKLRKSGLSIRDRETFVEQETTGLRPLRALSEPQLYGTEILRITRRSTNMLDDMKNGTYEDGNKNRIVGVGIYKIKEKAKTLASKIGIKFPEEVIPTRLKNNNDFKKTTPVLPETLQKIKGDAAGNLVGKFLAQNVKGTPNQIANAAIGNTISLVKEKARKVLLGGITEGQQSFGNKPNNGIAYDSKTKYTTIVKPKNTDIKYRFDLSTVLNTAGGDPQNLELINKATQDKKNTIILGKFFASLTQKKENNDLNKNIAANGGPLPSGKDILSPTFGKAVDLAAGRKEGQRILADKVEKSKGVNDILKYDPDNPQTTNYSNTVDEANTDEKSRNDLSTELLKRQIGAAFSNLGDKLTEIGIGNRGVPLKRVKKSYNEANLINSMEWSKNMDSTANALNQKNHYIANNDDVNKDYDDLDFITVKFTSIPTKKSVNFVATITGITENVTPTWDSNKFLGSPFEYYTYSGISRGATFNLKLFSLNAREHVTMWEKINLLTSFTYPAEYQNSTYVIPPFLKLTIGNLYKSKECFIESLTYTVDDTAGWEIGNNYSWYNIDGTTAIGKDGITNSVDKKLNDYKLPLVVDVSISVKFVETKKNTISNFYGYNSTIPALVEQKIEEQLTPQLKAKKEVAPNNITQKNAVNNLISAKVKQTNTSNLGISPTNNPLERSLATNGIPTENKKDLSTNTSNTFTIPNVNKSKSLGGGAIGGAYN
jgi:hypothetical protein